MERSSLFEAELYALDAALQYAQVKHLVQVSRPDNAHTLLAEAKAHSEVAYRRLCAVAARPLHRRDP